jgi:hypothetical protein
VNVDVGVVTGAAVQDVSRMTVKRNHEIVRMLSFIKTWRLSENYSECSLYPLLFTNFR